MVGTGELDNKKGMGSELKFSLFHLFPAELYIRTGKEEENLALLRVDGAIWSAAGAEILIEEYIEDRGKLFLVFNELENIFLYKKKSSSCFLPFCVAGGAFEWLRSALCPSGTSGSFIFLFFVVIVGSGSWTIGRFLVILGRRWGRGLAVLSGRCHAAQSAFVEDQGGRATLQTRVTSLAGPVAVARLAQRNVPVRVVLTQSCAPKI